MPSGSTVYIRYPGGHIPQERTAMMEMMAMLENSTAAMGLDPDQSHKQQQQQQQQQDAGGKVPISVPPHAKAFLTCYRQFQADSTAYVASLDAEEQAHVPHEVVHDHDHDHHDHHHHHHHH